MANDGKAEQFRHQCHLVVKRCERVEIATHQGETENVTQYSEHVAHLHNLDSERRFTKICPPISPDIFFSNDLCYTRSHKESNL